ncbi:hypothetical protein [Flavisolibacter ginsenosidimutans]|uniref:DUF4919 domain-containing protein n=1 Tax=Flavisolibacter ginsenosidimutans TaxID=661481 RepID=A0A5B8UM71_9BACT|nr:hypothetical protein [Flavisolibacter ginsenosidimutans]QEC57452.1 hypothetical protein FSB75_16605 [Flavisolibacter ginsenosidimutans]
MFLKRFAFVLFASFGFVVLHAQISNPDTMVRKLFATLPANDEKGFVALYPSPQQLMELVKSIMMSDEVRNQIAMGSGDKNINMDSLIQAQLATMSKPEVAAEMTKSFGKNFQRAVEKGKAKNIDWKKARLLSYTIDTAAGSDKDEAMLQKLGYKTMNGVIQFSVDTAMYQMQFSKILFIPKAAGWYGGEFGQIARKGETFLEEGETRIEGVSGDTTYTTTTVPKEIKTKTKSSKGKTKTKSVTKSPARKPTTKS